MTSWLSEAEWSALRLSVQVSILAVLATLPPAVAIAWLLARRRFPGKWLVETVLSLPLVMPPVVTGYLLLLLCGRNGPLGALLHGWGWSLAFHWTGAALAAAVVSFPLLVRSARQAMDSVDVRLEQAAHSLGAGSLRTFWRVTLPLAMPGVVAGSALAFARGMGEFGATITFVGNIEGETRTLPLALYTFLQQPGGDAPALRLLLLSVAVSALALAGHELLLRRLQVNRVD